MEKGIKNIIVVDISGVGLVRKVDTRGLNIINIRNSEDLGDTLNFDGERSKINMEIGYLDTLKAFHKLKGKKYYFSPSEDFRTYSRQYIKSINIDDLKKMYGYIGLNWGSKATSRDKLIIYKIMKTIKQYADEKLSGDTIIPAMAEITAEQLCIDRRKVYTLDELIGIIVEQYESVKSDKNFNEYIKYIGGIILSRNQREFDIEVRKVLIEGKFLTYYNPDMDEKDEKVKRYRRFLAVAFPKICISNLFIALVLSRK
jgi:NTE family protein